MGRLFVFVVSLLLPLQFAWSAASAYCQHETTERQSQHFGHHFHAHKGEAKKSPDSKLMADSDCASCHASAAAAIPTQLDGCDFEAASLSAEVVASPPFSSALARAPDRPQWLRLV
jgi:cytochrome c5